MLTTQKSTTLFPFETDRFRSSCFFPYAGSKIYWNDIANIWQDICNDEVWAICFHSDFTVRLFANRCMHAYQLLRGSVCKLWTCKSDLVLLACLFACNAMQLSISLGCETAKVRHTLASASTRTPANSKINIPIQFKIQNCLHMNTHTHTVGYFHIFLFCSQPNWIYMKHYVEAKLAVVYISLASEM